MKNVLLDTCAIIHIVKGSIEGKKCLEILSGIDEKPNIIISVVTKAEIESFYKQNDWGDKKLKTLQDLLDQTTIIDIKSADERLVEGYIVIDGYSKRKFSDKFGEKLIGAAKTMGKNDLWIAATAYATNSPLLTSDGDFDHLHEKLIEVIKIN